MNRKELNLVFSLLLLLICIKNSTEIEETCQFCGREFKALGRHLWRCAAKLNQKPSQTLLNRQENVAVDNLGIETTSTTLVNVNGEIVNNLPEGSLTEYDEEMQLNNDSNNIIKCHCGKECKGNRGLRAHQRFCKIVDMPELRELFNNELLTNIQPSTAETLEHEHENLRFRGEQPIKPGLKLPKTKEEWTRANDFFKAIFDHTMSIVDIDEEIIGLQNSVYN